MPRVGEWHGPYKVNWLRQNFPVLLLLVVLFFCFNGAPFAFGIRRGWWLVLLNPLADLYLLAAPSLRLGRSQNRGLRR